MTTRLSAVICGFAVFWLMPRAPELIDRLGSDDFPTAIGALVALTALGIAVWSLAVLAVGLVEPELARRLAPPLIGGLLVVTALPLAAQATAPGALGGPLDGLRLPDRPEAPVVTSTSTTPAVQANGHVVTPGDTLWTIVAARLGSTASDAEIAVAVQQWAASNRHVIGSDPNLIRPGQRLTPPEGTP